MEETVLASCSGVAKIFKVNSSQTPREHSCSIALVRVGSNLFLQQEGNGIKKNRQKVKGENIHKLETRRLSEGYLTIILTNALWETVAIIKADVNALKRLISCLEKLKSRSNVGSTFTRGTSPSSSTSLPVRADMLPTTPSLMRHPNNLRCASTTSPATKGYGTSESKGFYGTSTPEPFLPDNRMYSPSKTPRGSPCFASSDGFSRSPSRTPQKSPVFSARQNAASESPLMVPKKPLFYSARRSLTMDVEKRAEHDLEDDFKPNPKFRSLSDNSVPTSVDGFANMGNTCYMNAVLQSLVGMEPFAMDVLNQKLVQAVQKGSLYLMLHLLVKSKKSKDSFRSQNILLRRVRGAISSRAAKFGGYRQQDAHELLGQCLDQLKDDVCSGSSMPPGSQLQCGQPLCPVIRNFECEILRTIKCKNCGSETKISEVIYDFALQLPKSVLVRHNQQANLQQLFESYFAEEEVEFACKACNGKTASLKQQLSRLPRVMILHLKRYGYSTLLSKHSKRVDHIRIPRLINTGDLCATGYTPPIEFKGAWPRDNSCLSSLVAENKENTSPGVGSPLIPIADVASIPLVAAPPTTITVPPPPTLITVTPPPQNLTTVAPPNPNPPAVPSAIVPQESHSKQEFFERKIPTTSVDRDSVVPVLSPTGLTELSEEEELKMALEESLKGQQAEVHFLRQIEEEQLQMALDLSIKESSGMVEAPPTSPVRDTPVTSPIPMHAPSNIEAYKLVSIVSHLGKGSGGGHYISDVHSIGSKTWRTYNDEFVSDVKEEDVRQLRQTTGYIFFYMHRVTCKSVESHCK